MKAIHYTHYGEPDVLTLKKIEKPIPKANEILVKVHAVSLNASDCEMLKGSPAYVRIWGLFKPKFKILGSDISGCVEALGKDVPDFQLGEEVVGDNFERWGGLAEYVCIPAKKLLLKPKKMSFEKAASIPQAGVVALQGLRNKIAPGQKVLINGAGGGAGSFAVQLAKMLGAHVTAVDNAEKIDFLRSLGADRVLDYQQEDYTLHGAIYDLIVDFVAHRSIYDIKRALKPQGQYVMVGGSIKQLFQVLIVGTWISITSKKKIGILGHRQNKIDINYLFDLVTSATIQPCIDRVFPINETSEAFRYLSEGHAKGKVVIKVNS